MSGVLNKMKTFFMGYDEYDEDYMLEEESMVDISPATSTSSKSEISSFDQPKVLNIHKNTKVDIMNFKMAKYEVTGDICNYIKQRKPVVVNMQSLEKASAQRALDYLTGATFALDGTVQKIADNVFIFSPQHISVSTISEELKQKSNFSFQ
ncbi:MAG: cell division protein SepF [Epulopiscium sp.]|nr:cell division protein SepF [Candidatus Epulonipiscium sp.]